MTCRKFTTTSPFRKRSVDSGSGADYLTGQSAKPRRVRHREVRVPHGDRPVHEAAGVRREGPARPEDAAGADAVLQAGELVHGKRGAAAGGTGDLIGGGCDCRTSAHPPKEAIEARRRGANEAARGDHYHTVANPAKGESA